jgi:hypothetical protein
VRNHLLVSKFVPFSELDNTIKDKHAPIRRGVKHLNVLKQQSHKQNSRSSMRENASLRACVPYLQLRTLAFQHLADF